MLPGENIKSIHSNTVLGYREVWCVLGWRGEVGGSSESCFEPITLLPQPFKLLGLLACNTVSSDRLFYNGNFQEIGLPS